MTQYEALAAKFEGAEGALAATYEQLQSGYEQMRDLCRDAHAGWSMERRKLWIAEEAIAEAIRWLEAEGCAQESCPRPSGPLIGDDEMTRREELLALADDLDALNEWMRKPDWSDHFALMPWLNNRPTHIAPRASAALRALASQDTAS